MYTPYLLLLTSVEVRKAYAVFFSDLTMYFTRF